SPPCCSANHSSNEGEACRPVSCHSSISRSRAASCSGVRRTSTASDRQHSRHWRERRGQSSTLEGTENEDRQARTRRGSVAQRGARRKREIAALVLPSV